MASTTILKRAYGLLFIPATIVAMASPTVAASNDGSCDLGERCGYRDSFQAGSMVDHSGNDDNFANESGGDDAMYSAGGTQDTPTSGDRISSVVNRETVGVFWHADQDCGGDDTLVGAGGDLDTMPGGAGDVGDNEASSQATTTAPC